MGGFFLNFREMCGWEYQLEVYLCRSLLNEGLSGGIFEITFSSKLASYILPLHRRFPIHCMQDRTLYIG